MALTLNHGWLSPARHCESPHQDERPEGEISLLVVHCISLPPGKFGEGFIDDLFLGRLNANAHPYFAGIHRLRVSAHCLIRRDGELVQYVPFHRRAWHAGVSCFEGRERCNDFSIGIELEGTDTGNYTPEQYRVLAEVSSTLMRAYPAITPERITGHSDIAPGRKTDPGPGFDWARFRALL
ncbi:1,6-anhydro-N-acetylmuramyl-L-alanine amidase AmpD [Oceanimonas pelagia]|uniref:1,6-anhydro-N-acetylmuramyl-L-alanine amidase AmpD n=1 Tax=Oceanimonas pelagia TaxID=3028314 RepID=A0AA50QCE7_9GAMM|nr:1,6-anhydro-N-acetylmuramyl-L-alanine amidase AmpD [Oceanimonas pelagia]WMC11079.1 1,6-anhydro-N-acetylmuramyl-L-alanine amidase AmpD [Oceanimonas pelagia]